MVECILMKAGSGTGSDECTATKGNVLAGKTAVTSDSDDEAVAGTMPNKGSWTSRIGVNGKAVIPAGYHNGTGYVDQAITNRGAVSASLGINGTYTIPAGYHNGAGKVTQSIDTMGAQTVTPGNSQKVVSCSGKYMTGNVTVQAVSNLIAANIKKGVVVGGVTGTWEGYVANPTDIYNNGAAYFGVAIKGSGVVESNSLELGTTYSAAWIYTTQPINLTGYTGIAVEVMNKGNPEIKTKGSLYIFRGSNGTVRGTQLSLVSDIDIGNQGRRVTHYLPFQKDHNITDTVGIAFGISTGSYSTNFYRIWLYK